MQTPALSSKFFPFGTGVVRLSSDFRNLSYRAGSTYPTVLVLDNGNITEMRSAVRFPVRLPIAIRDAAGEHQAETNDMSAGGVLFNIDSDMTVGSNIEFTISIPAGVIGAPADVMVSGEGRVVRSSPQGERTQVAAVIDEYRFERA